MINHFRTLLLNMSPDNTGSSALGEEYVDPSFTPMILTGKLRTAHAVLVPNGASRTARNFYCYAWLCLAHAPDFEKYVTTFDPRITYSMDSGVYLSADTARSTYPGFQINTMYSGLASALFSPGTSLFDMAPDYKDDMALFKDIWYGGPSQKDKVTAGLMAVIYVMEGARIHGQ